MADIRCCFLGMSFRKSSSSPRGSYSDRWRFLAAERHVLHPSVPELTLPVLNCAGSPSLSLWLLLYQLQHWTWQTARSSGRCAADPVLNDMNRQYMCMAGRLTLGKKCSPVLEHPTFFAVIMFQVFYELKGWYNGWRHPEPDAVHVERVMRLKSALVQIRLPHDPAASPEIVSARTDYLRLHPQWEDRESVCWIPACYLVFLAIRSPASAAISQEMAVMHRTQDLRACSPLLTTLEASRQRRSPCFWRFPR